MWAAFVVHVVPGPESMRVPESESIFGYGHKRDMRGKRVFEVMQRRRQTQVSLIGQWLVSW